MPPLKLPWSAGFSPPLNRQYVVRDMPGNNLGRRTTHHPGNSQSAALRQLAKGAVVICV